MDSPTRTIFQTYEWLWSWESVFKDQVTPLYLAVAPPDGRDGMGVAPLVIAREFPGRRIVKFLGDGRADYCDLLYPHERMDVLEQLFDRLFALRSQWDCIQFNSVPAESPTIAGMQALCAKYRCRWLQRDLYLSPTLVIQGCEEEAEKIFNKPSLRRRENYFRRLGRLTFRTVYGPEAVPCLDGFFAQHIARWSATPSPSLFRDERNRKFYRTFIEAMEKERWVVLSIVELDDRPLAMHLGFEYDGRLLWYKPTFDPTYAKHSPGLVLLRCLIRYAIDRKLDEFDFGIGGEPFKFRFANKVRTTVQCEIFQHKIDWLLAKARARWRAVKQRLART
ncbi:MAG: GNAT family N-acetyltransferase [Nitrospira sp.]|nr:GNAT family N-acetyltransferase [Nitrospira sp.]MCP9442471.1 GNAT family N-acetyltransferase [Nitrospira sp.]